MTGRPPAGVSREQNDALAVQEETSSLVFQLCHTPREEKKSWGGFSSSADLLSFCLLDGSHLPLCGPAAAPAVAPLIRILFSPHPSPLFFSPLVPLPPSASFDTASEHSTSQRNTLTPHFLRRHRFFDGSYLFDFEHSTTAKLLWLQKKQKPKNKKQFNDNQKTDEFNFVWFYFMLRKALKFILIWS